jgi:DNA-binding response OmpR family regulator
LTQSLTGKRVLLVEDEAIIALAIEDMLREIGCEVVGPALDVTRGEQLAKDAALDAAVLDINLGGRMSHSIAQILRARRLPFCFSTGYASAEIPAGFESIQVLQKPYDIASLRSALVQLLS